MKANAGDATVAIALEDLTGATSTTEYGTIQVMISRKNKSLTVSEVEQEVTERIAAMEIEDEVALMLDEAITELDLDADILAIVEDELAALDIATEVNSTLTIALRNLGLIDADTEISSTTASNTPEEVPGWMERVVDVVINTISDTFTAVTGYFTSIFATTTHTETLCVGTPGDETCITKTELDALLINAVTEEVEPESVTPEPVVELPTSTPPPAPVQQMPSTNEASATTTEEALPLAEEIVQEEVIEEVEIAEPIVENLPIEESESDIVNSVQESSSEETAVEVSDEVLENVEQTVVLPEETNPVDNI